MIGLAVGLTPMGCGPPTPAVLTVLGAASLTEVLTETIDTWSRTTGTPVRYSFAGSSLLARQVEAGAPADIVAFADIEWMDYLATRDLLEPGSRSDPYSNQLVMIAANGDRPEDGLRTIPSALETLQARDRLAVGDPAHVPVGRYAREALEGLGLWNDVEPRLAIAQDTRSALALVERGETPLGIVYATDVRISDRVHIVAAFPDSVHSPIRYAFARTRGSHPAAEHLLAYLVGAESAAGFERYGFHRVVAP